MISPLTLPQMIAASRLDALKTAIVATLKPLLPRVTITLHPGRLDINDLLAKAIVAAPGVAIGWTRLRASREIGGTYGTPIDLAAYIVTEDYSDTSSTPPRLVARDVVAHGIGSFLLRILHDPDAPTWGLTGITHPLPEPAPELRPVVTMKTAENGTAVYAVTWSQATLLEGASLFGGPRPEITGTDDGFEFPLPEGADIPTELLALMRRDAP